ncbi:hypothetical protein YC2023_045852 [Brassica napus]
MLSALFWSQYYYSFKNHKPISLQEIIGEGTKVKVEQKIDPSIYVGSFNKRCLTCQVSTRAQQMERLLVNMLISTISNLKDSKQRDNKGKNMSLSLMNLLPICEKYV